MNQHLLSIANQAYNTTGNESRWYYKTHPHESTLLIANTKFLPSKTSIVERAYCVINALSSIPLCKICVSPVSWNKEKRQYKKCCSRKCSNADTDRLEKMKQTNMIKYGVEHTFQSQQFRNKIKKSNLATYGSEWISQRKFPKNIITKLNDYEWLYEQHITKKCTLREISISLDCHESTIGNRLRYFDIPICNYYQSVGEKEVGTFIQSILPSGNVEYNTRAIIPPYELDVYIPSHNLAIEYCGLYWHSEQHGLPHNYHKNKHDKCASLGIQLITLFEDEWFSKQDQVKSKLAQLVHAGNTNKIYARQTQISSISTKDKNSFFDKYHIQGSGPGSVNLGLFYHNNCIACMSFIISSKHTYLNRYATSISVPGGFSKLLTHFKRNYKWSTLISFADLRWSNGKLYNTTGWTLDSILPPDYCYSPDGKHRYHKFGYRRKYLNKKLTNFDPNISEWENCKANNILRIWDCGKLKYIMINDAS